MKLRPNLTLNKINPDDKMLTIGEVAERTGVNIKRIKRAIEDRELRFYAFGTGSKRVRLSDLERWWEKYRVR
jgi:excisionase family DNA binding protein